MLTSILISCRSVPLFLLVSLLTARTRKFHLQLIAATSGGARTPIKLLHKVIHPRANHQESDSVQNNHIQNGLAKRR